MKPQTSFRFLLLFFFVFFFLSHAAGVFATFTTENFDPTHDYTIHSVPVLDNQSPANLLFDSNELAKQSPQSDVQLSTLVTQKNTPTFFTRFQKGFSEVSKSLDTVFSSVTKVLANSFAAGAHALSQSLYTHGGDWLLMLGVISVTSTTGFIILSSPLTFSMIKMSLKSSTDLEIRLVGFVSAVILSVTTGSAVLSTYNQQLAFFESYTGWKFNPLWQDVLFVGTVLVAGVLFFEGVSLVLEARTVFAAGAAFLPSWKKIVEYFAKETKTAFTETDKECEETVDKCSSLFDKTVILLFNYLPGTMPDLGIDDAIINFKNSFFKTPQPHKVGEIGSGSLD